MKTLRQISTAVCLGILCGLGCGRSEMTKDKAEALFNEVGGAREIDREAKAIFDHLGTNVSTAIYGESLTKFLAISSLASSVFLQTNPGWSTHIEMPFGSDYQRNFIFIFDSDAPIEFPYRANCLAVTTYIPVAR
jgi:hypothetical protein